MASPDTLPDDESQREVCSLAASRFERYLHRLYVVTVVLVAADRRVWDSPHPSCWRLGGLDLPAQALHIDHSDLLHTPTVVRSSPTLDLSRMYSRFHGAEDECCQTGEPGQRLLASASVGTAVRDGTQSLNSSFAVTATALFS